MRVAWVILWGTAACVHHRPLDATGARQVVRDRELGAYEGMAIGLVLGVATGAVTGYYWPVDRRTGENGREPPGLGRLTPGGVAEVFGFFGAFAGALAGGVTGAALGDRTIYAW